MFTKGFGEVIADFLTVNPAIAEIPSASAILDTSNFTFYCFTLGKDADGFNYHAHTISATDGSPYNQERVLFNAYNTNSPSSYHTSSTWAEFPSYSSVPQAPSPYDTRLEDGDTTTNASTVGLPNLGHYSNITIVASLSSVWNVVSPYPPSGAASYYNFYDGDGVFQFSGTLSGVFNEFGIMDRDGYLKMSEVVNSTNIVGDTSGGAVQSNSPSYTPSSGGFKVAIVPKLGDAAALAAFGGVTQVGVYCLDIKAKLASGLTPPYTWDALNTNRQYKMVAKITSWDSFLNHDDLDLTAVNPGLGFAGDNSGFEDILNSNTEKVYGVPFFTNQGPTISLIFRFT